MPVEVDDSLMALALDVATDAAHVAFEGYRSRPAVDEKGKKDLVTEFDRAAERSIVDALTARTPEIPILAEEGTQSARFGTGWVWCVDPLDGTTNFVHGHPFWCSAIGLSFDGAPVLGAIVAPVLGLSWCGIAPSAKPERPGRAQRNGEPIRVSTTDALERSLIATGFPPDRSIAPDNNFDAFMRVMRACRGVRRCGSAALDICLVADGTYDAYWERKLNAWDVVGASAIALGAGGRVTSLTGGEPDYGRGHVVVSNRQVHDALVHELAER